jgi:hypothetical protein
MADVVALASVLSSAVVAIGGLALSYRTSKEQRRHEQRLEEVRLRKDFLLEQYRYRPTAYRDVLTTLGSVSDVDYQRDSGWQTKLIQNRDVLRETADSLYKQLYGEAGLLMTMRTRNYIHQARWASLAFLNSDAQPEDFKRLINAFFYARRYLRADLELMDERTPDNVEELAKRLASEDMESADRSQDGR